MQMWSLAKFLWLFVLPYTAVMQKEALLHFKQEKTKISTLLASCFLEHSMAPNSFNTDITIKTASFGLGRDGSLNKLLTT